MQGVPMWPHLYFANSAPEHYTSSDGLRLLNDATDGRPGVRAGVSRPEG